VGARRAAQPGAALLLQRPVALDLYHGTMDTSWDDHEPSAEEPVASEVQAAPAADGELGDPMVIVASDRIAEIVRAAEQTAEQVRAEAEHRADERIAEADRAAEYRVSAAEEEAREILAA